LGGAGVAGTVLAAERDVPAPGSHRVLLVQPGTLAEGMRGPVATAVALVRQTAEAPAFDLVVWPENAVSAVLPTNVHLVRTALAKRSGAHLILGAPRFEPDERGLRISALLIDASGRTLAYHDKNHLLPFAEYAPGPLPMRWFGSMEVQPGETPGALPVQGTPFGPLICYEVLFAPLARAQVRAGATVLLNLSNDAWFGDTGAAEQHLAAAMYRALESGRPLLRATHTGLTAAIDANGRVVARLPMHEPGTLLVDVVPRSRPTPMLYWGEGPVWLAFGLAVALPAVRRLGRLRTAEEHASVEV
jgi:apolipoprotein N-acyltransferase